MVALSALVSGLDDELVRLVYKDSTMLWYRGSWRRLAKFFTAVGAHDFSLDLAMAWVDEACGFFGKERAGTLKPADVYLFRVAQMLGDYAAHGAVLRRYSRTIDKVTGDGADLVTRFQVWLREAGRAVSTVRTYATVAGEFVAFVDTRGGLAGCGAGAIEAFVAALAGYQFKTVEQKLCPVRSFLRFACVEGLIDAPVLDLVPAVKSRKQTRIPSVWDPADVAKILDAIDRGNPCGKRDYAIILLVTRLGLRSIDVKRLEFSDLDWPGNRLSVVQVKTGRRVQLPLPERGRLGGHRLHPRRPAAQRLPTGVLAAHRPDRPVLRPGPPAPDPSQTRPGGPCPGQRETPPRHAFTAAHAGDPADGGRHTHRADRRHPRSPVRPVDRGVSEIIAGPFGQVRTGSG
jgi:integrase